MKKTALILFAVFTVSCASSRMSDRETDRLFAQGRYAQAAERLRAGLEKEGDGADQLIWLLDLALTLHTQGEYEESNRYFLEADKIAEIKDYTSLAAETGTLLTSDNVKHYQGEDFEKVLINTYLAMNFAFLGQYESALVEARRVNRKLYLMITEGKRKYKQNEFARYLSGILYEASGEYNDAYIDYKQALELNGSIVGIGRDLYRMAWLLRMPDEMERWKNQFGLGPSDIEEAKRLGPRTGWGEIIVIYQNGISPRKVPNPQFHSLPIFRPRHNPVGYAQVSLDGEIVGGTTLLHDIESTAIQNLDEKYGAMVAKKIAGVVAKEATGYAVEKATDSPALGFLTKLFLYASDTADVRSWSLLPRDLQILRIPAKPGEHEVVIQPKGASRRYAPHRVKVEAGKKAFITQRYAPDYW